MWIEYFIYALLVASLNLATQEYMKEGMILGFYRQFLLKMYRSKRNYKMKLSQVLGLCIYCNSFWLSILVVFTVFEVSVSTLLFPFLVFTMIKILQKLGIAE